MYCITIMFQSFYLLPYVSLKSSTESKLKMIKNWHVLNSYYWKHKDLNRLYSTQKSCSQGLICYLNITMFLTSLWTIASMFVSVINNWEWEKKHVPINFNHSLKILKFSFKIILNKKTFLNYLYQQKINIIPTMKL